MIKKYLNFFLESFENYYIEINNDRNFAVLINNGVKFGQAFLSMFDEQVLSITGKEITLEFDEKNIYIISIKVEEQYVGKKIGKIFIKLLFEYFGNDKFTFYSRNHPYWDKVAYKLPYTTFDGKGQYYYITKEMYL